MKLTIDDRELPPSPLHLPPQASISLIGSDAYIKYVTSVSVSAVRAVAFTSGTLVEAVVVSYSMGRP